MFYSSCFETYDRTARCRQSNTAHADILYINQTAFNQTWSQNFDSNLADLKLSTKFLQKTALPANHT